MTFLCGMRARLCWRMRARPTLSCTASFCATVCCATMFAARLRNACCFNHACICTPAVHSCVSGNLHEMVCKLSSICMT